MAQGHKPYPTTSSPRYLFYLQPVASGPVCVYFMVRASEACKRSKLVSDTALTAASLRHLNWQRPNSISTKATGAKYYC